MGSYKYYELLIQLTTMYDNSNRAVTIYTVASCATTTTKTTQTSTLKNNFYCIDPYFVFNLAIFKNIVYTHTKVTERSFFFGVNITQSLQTRSIFLVINMIVYKLHEISYLDA